MKSNIPKFDDLFEVVLIVFKDSSSQQLATRVIKENSIKYLIEQEYIDDSILEGMFNSKNTNRQQIEYRIGWALTYLKHFRAVENVEYGVWAITDLGLWIINQKDKTMFEKLKIEINNNYKKIGSYYKLDDSNKMPYLEKLHERDISDLCEKDQGMPNQENEINWIAEEIELRLRSVEINNIKNINKKRKFSFYKNQNDFKKMVVIGGANGVGKTTIFEIINLIQKCIVVNNYREENELYIHYYKMLQQELKNILKNNNSYAKLVFELFRRNSESEDINSKKFGTGIITLRKKMINSLFCLKNI